MSSSPRPRPEPGLRGRLRLARRILEVHYFQPATALWRLFELESIGGRLASEGRGLDLGCGDGTLASIYLAAAPAVRWTGLDVEPRDLELARRRGLYERVHLASASAIPERDASFDLVFANSSLEHMDGLPAVISEVARVLKPGGRFAFTVPSERFRDELLWARVLRRIGARRAADRYLGHLDRRLAHVNYLSADDWRRLLAGYGLRLEHSEPFLSRRALGLWETLANATGGLVYLLTAGTRSPRQVQLSAGVQGRRRPLVGALATALLLPWLLPAAVERAPRRFAAALHLARRAG